MNRHSTQTTGSFVNCALLQGTHAYFQHNSAGCFACRCILVKTCIWPVGPGILACTRCHAFSFWGTVCRKHWPHHLWGQYRAPLGWLWKHGHLVKYMGSANQQDFLTTLVTPSCCILLCNDCDSDRCTRLCHETLVHIELHHTCMACILDIRCVLLTCTQSL